MVRSGKDRGTKGKITHVLSALDRVVVEGVNVRKKRQKPRKQGQKGQVLEAPHPIHRSNVLLFCEKCKKGVRFGTQISGAKKVRVCRHCAKEL